MQKPRVLVIIPAYNERGKIGNTIKRAIPFADAILVVDDGSTDNTKEEVKKNKAKVIIHETNKGVGAAIRSGIDYAIKNEFDVCIPLAGDDQDAPEEIPKLLSGIKKGYDLIQGSRYLKQGRTINAPLFRIITTKLYSLFFSIVSGRYISDASNGFKAFKISIFNNKEINLWQEWLNKYELEPYLLYKTITLGYKVTEAPVSKRYLIKRGYSKMKPFLDWWRISRPLIYLKLGLKR